MTNDATTKYAAKLKLLLELAADAGDTPEGRLAQARAFEFMEKYGLDEAMASAAGERPGEELTHRLIEITGIYDRQLHDLAVALARVVAGAHPLGFATTRGQKPNRSVAVHGYASAVTTVQVLYASLRLQALGELKPAWTAAVKDSPWLDLYTPMERFVWKREFIAGFTGTVITRLIAARERTVQASQDAGLVGAEVALRDRNDEAATYAAGFTDGNTIKRGKLGSHNDSAYHAGKVAGQSASLGDDASVGGVSRPALT